MHPITPAQALRHAKEWAHLMDRLDDRHRSHMGMRYIGKRGYTPRIDRIYYLLYAYNYPDHLRENWKLDVSFAQQDEEARQEQESST